MTDIPSLFWLTIGFGLMWFLIFLGVASLVGGPPGAANRRRPARSSSWTVLYRLGVVMLLVSIAGETGGRVVEIAAWVALVGAAAPFALPLIRTAWIVINANRTGEST